MTNCIKVKRAHKFKLYPTDEQLKQFAQMSGNARFVYNALLEWSSWIHNNTERKSVVNRKWMHAELVRMKNAPELEWLKLSHSQSLQVAADNLISAFKRLFRKQGGYPKFKSKHDPKRSFGYKQGVRVDGNKVYLPKVGWVRFNCTRDHIGKIKAATVSKSSLGWYVSLSVEEEIEQFKPNQFVVGVDLGISRYATLSSGEYIENPRYYIRAQRKLGKLQKALSRKKKGSANRAKARKKVARLHERVANKRRDFQHQLSHQLVSENQVIGVESLHVKGMLKNRNLAKHISDAAWGEMLWQIKYKANWHSKLVVPAGRFYPSSKTTNCCGISLENLTLADRTIVCPECGQVWDRDHNAAINIENVAARHAETVNAFGGVVSRG